MSDGLRKQNFLTIKTKSKILVITCLLFLHFLNIKTILMFLRSGFHHYKVSNHPGTASDEGSSGGQPVMSVANIF